MYFLCEKLFSIVADPDFIIILQDPDPRYSKMFFPEPDFNFALIVIEVKTKFVIFQLNNFVRKSVYYFSNRNGAQ